MSGMFYISILLVTVVTCICSSWAAVLDSPSIKTDDNGADGNETAPPYIEILRGMV